MYIFAIYKYVFPHKFTNMLNKKSSIHIYVCMYANCIILNPTQDLSLQTLFFTEIVFLQVVIIRRICFCSLYPFQEHPLLSHTLFG